MVQEQCNSPELASAVLIYSVLILLKYKNYDIHISRQINNSFDWTILISKVHMYYYHWNNLSNIEGIYQVTQLLFKNFVLNFVFLYYDCYLISLFYVFVDLEGSYPTSYMISLMRLRYFIHFIKLLVVNPLWPDKCTVFIIMLPCFLVKM